MLTATCTPQVGDPFDIDYAINIRYDQALQQLGKFEIRLVSSAEELAKYDYNDRIEIKIDSTVVFAGIIEKIVHNEREIVLSGRNTAAKLLWKITDAAKEYLDQYPDDVVKDILSGTAISYDGGSIQHYDTQLSYRFDRENKARAIAGVANSIGYEWWVEEDDLLYFKEQRGQDKSGSITLSDDIISVDQSFDATRVIDKLTVVGMGPGSTHLEITVGSGNMEGVLSEKEIHDIDTLTTFANAALLQTKDEKHRVEIKLAGTERTEQEHPEEQIVSNHTNMMFSPYQVKQGQKLTVPNRKVTKLGFWLAKYGNPPGELTFKIRKVSDDSVMASKVWGNASDLSDVEFLYTEVTFDSPVTINEEVRMVLEVAEGGDESNCVGMRVYQGDIKAAECLTSYIDSWNDDTAYDCTYRYKWLTDIEVGDTVHIHHTDSGLDGDYRIISIARVSGVSGDFTKLEIALSQFRVTEIFMDLGRRADARDYHPQGAPSILTLARADNVDSTHSLKMKFYVPPEAVDMGKLQIKEAKVALTLEAFRAYQTGAASGGGHTSGASSTSTTAAGGQQTTSSGGGQTTSSGGGQTTSDGGGQTSSGGAAHSHGISGQTAESAGAHRHKMFDGVSSSAWSDPSYYHLVAAYANEAGTLERAIKLGSELSSVSDYWTHQEVAAHSHSVTGTTSASESSHTHTVADHTHTVSDHTHTVANHTHSVDDHTHGMEHTHQVQDHTHDIAYGIYESTSPADVYIKLNTVQIAGPFNADGYIDITTEFLNQITTYGWNTLEFTSTQLGKIGATLFMRLFLQAS